jgi:methionyl aminopeptidase
MMTRVKTSQEITAMRESGRLLATVLATLKEALEPGMTTKDLAEIAKRELRSTDGQPTFLGYYGFPDVLCVSINQEVVHGIPSSKRVIQDGDIVSLDFGVTYKGMITDSALTVIAGKPLSSGDQKLVDTTKISLEAGIAACRGGVHVGDIANAIETVLKRANYGIVRDLVGHGVGHELHEDPNIPNYGHAGSGPVLKPGMTIAIEPMATLGDYKVYIANDQWTVITRDNSRAAHFEHTVLITEKGAEILTQL